MDHFAVGRNPLGIELGSGASANQPTEFIGRRWCTWLPNIYNEYDVSSSLFNPPAYYF
jgi:hypothetical protein